MDGTEDHHVEQNKPDSKSKGSFVLSNMWKLEGKKVKKRNLMNIERRPIELRKGIGRKGGKREYGE